jgi:hypothetical protein
MRYESLTPGNFPLIDAGSRQKNERTPQRMPTARKARYRQHLVEIASHFLKWWVLAMSGHKEVPKIILEDVLVKSPRQE